MADQHIEMGESKHGSQMIRSDTRRTVKMHQRQYLIKKFEKVEDSLFISIELFKAVMACLLVVFVPQNCPLTCTPEHQLRFKFECFQGAGQICSPNNRTQFDEYVLLNGEEPTPCKDICTFQEQFIDLTPVNKAALGINFIVLGLIITMYSVIWFREIFLVDKLDADPTKPRINLQNVFKAEGQYEHIQNKLWQFNRALFFLTGGIVVIQILNVILSATVVFSAEYYLDYRTVTAFLTNILLLVNVIKNTAMNSWQGMRENIALSCIDMEPTSYNVIDAEYVVAA